MTEQGWWKGDPMPVSGVKFKTEFQGIPISVDRPKGFIQTGKSSDGEEWSRQYKYDYGFIPKTEGGDGDGLDVFLGPDKKSPEAYWALQQKDDGSFDEYKVFLGFDTKDEATAVFKDHIPKKLLGGMVTMRIDMMKAMLGMDSTGANVSGTVKAASFVGFKDEVEKIKKYLKRSPRQVLTDEVLDAAGDLKEDVGL